MRDIAFVALMLVLAIMSLRKPSTAAATFVWLGLTVPHGYTFGFAQQFPWANLFGLILFYSALRSGLDNMLKVLVKNWLFVLVVIWTSITTITAFSGELAVVKLQYFAKVVLGAYLVLCTLKTRDDVAKIVLVFCLSIGLFGLKGGPWVIATGAASGSVKGPVNSQIEDNNDIAVAFVTCIPMLIWAFQHFRHRLIKIFIGVMIASTLIAILGTYSRGGFLALGTCLTFLTFLSKHRMRIALIIIPVLALGLSIMPAKFWDRMSTIQTYDQDESANSRIYAWITAYRIANDRPLGGGFDYYKTPPMMMKYAPPESIPRNIHSLFFSMLGEHGYIGLMLLLAMLLKSYLGLAHSAVFRSIHTRKLSIEDEIRLRDAEFLRRMMKVSLVSFVAGATFINLSYWEGFYYLMGLSIMGVEIYARGSVDTRAKLPLSNRVSRPTQPYAREASH